MKIALTGIALALSLALAGVAAPVDAQSGGYRGGPPPGGTGGGYRGGPPQGGGYRGGPPQGGGFRGGPPSASGFRGAPPPATWRGAWRGPGWNSWHGGGRPWGPAWRPGWGWGGWGWNGWGWGTGWGPGWGVGWNSGWGWGPGVWGWGVGAPIVVAPSSVSVWALPFEPTVYVEREGASAEAPVAPAVAPSTQQWWYWCASAHGYYPYVGACPEGWQRVAPQVPTAPQ
jgi:hypothetical protein